jgi:hypothetical protein
MEEAMNIQTVRPPAVPSCRQLGTTSTVQAKTHVVGTKVRLGATLAVAVIAGATAFFSGSGTALAPEPAKLTAPLGSAGGMTAAAYYPNSLASTTVIKWGGTFVTGGAAMTYVGHPCSTVPLASGELVTMTLVAAPSPVSGPLVACR